MVDIKEIEDNFRKFRTDFWEDIADFNLEKRKIDLNEIKTKMMESDYFKVVQEFAKERGWNVEIDDIKIAVKKGKETIDIDLVNCDKNILFINPWSRVVDRLKRIEKLSKD